MNAGIRPGLAGAGVLALPGLALAHGGELDWRVPPSDALPVLLPLLVASLLFAAGVLRRQRAGALSAVHGARTLAFFSAVLLLVLALVWPLDAWSGLSFAAHMGQHMVLLALAPPLLVLARPGAMVLRGLPQALQRAVLAPRRWPLAALSRRGANSIGATGLLHAAVLWGWHVPAAFELALRNEAVHWLEHVTLLASGMLYWRALLRARGGAAGWALASMLSTLLHTGVLGALLTLAPRPLYPSYAVQHGVQAALADQQLAGLIMWVPMGTVYLVAALAVAAGLLRGAPGAAAASGADPRQGICPARAVRSAG